MKSVFLQKVKVGEKIWETFVLTDLQKDILDECGLEYSQFFNKTQSWWIVKLIDD